MSNNYFDFKQFTICQDNAAFKVGTDGVLLGACADISGVKRILDIGTGTGLISIMLAQRCEAEIVAIEPDADSYTCANQNVNNCRWRNRIDVEHTDLQGYSTVNDKFDLIICNPPYFRDSLSNPDLRKSLTRHAVTLSSEVLLEGVSRLLGQKGKLQVIMPYVEGSIFIAEAQQYGLFCSNILKIKPLPASEIRRLVMTFSKEKLKVIEKFLTIERGGRHEFTEEYINLTKDFYLKF